MYFLCYHRRYGIKEKPEICEKSKEISANLNYKPIYSRYEEILEVRNKKQQAKLDAKAEKEEQ